MKLHRPVSMGMMCALSLFAQAAIAADKEGTSFFDDFSNFDRNRWMTSDGWNNGPHQNCQWAKSAVALGEDMLTLRFEKRKLKDREFVCGELQSKAKYSFGTYEARIKTPSGSGLNAAFFTFTGKPLGDPHDEIDFEVLLKDTSGVSIDHHVNGKDQGARFVKLDRPTDQDYSDYAFVWKPGSITWYVNGKKVDEVKDGPLPSHAQKILFSLWGSDTLDAWMGKFEAPAAPLEMKVDWAAFTKLGEPCHFKQSIVCKSEP